MTISRRFALPESLISRVAHLTAQEERSRQRRQHQKRFVRGLIGDDLSGFFLNGRRMRLEDIPPSLRNLGPASGAGNVPGIPGPGDARLEASWLEVSAEIHRELSGEMLNSGPIAEVIRQFREGGQLPGWLEAFGRNAGRQFIDLKRVQAYRKESLQIREQTEWYDHLAEKQPELAQYFIPLVAFELPDHRVLGVMPCLSSFITLHDLLLLAAGLQTFSPAPLNSEEAREVLPEIATELSRILQLAGGISPDQSWRMDHGWQNIVNRIEDRFDPSHEVFVLAGEQALGQARDLALNTVRDLGQQLWDQTEDNQLVVSHGDLNATNIMVAVRRDATRSICDVCVRLIDPNPEGSVGHVAVELARLIHWIELSMPLRFRRAQSDAESIKNPSTVEVHYRGASVEEDFINQRPVVRLNPQFRERLAGVYESFLRSLRTAFPTLRAGDGGKLLSISTGVFHLVATKYWPGNIDRTSAFWAGILEFGSVREAHSAVTDNGLWNLRRRLRGRATYSGSESVDRRPAVGEATEH